MYCLSKYMMESKNHGADKAVSYIHTCIMNLSVYIITIGKIVNCPIANCLF